MKLTIKRIEYNHVVKCLRDLNQAFANCVDEKVVQATQGYLQEKIYNHIDDLTPEREELLDIMNLTNQLEIDVYLENLKPYIESLPKITNNQIKKIFKKDKKLRIPKFTEEDYKGAYLSWVDDSTRKLYVLFYMENKYVGMACRIPNPSNRNIHVCSVCHKIGENNDVAFVSPVCKSRDQDKGAYRSIGFEMCLHGDKCNERIMHTERLEAILKKVNNIKETH